MASKQEKEDFVSGLEGTTVAEIYLLTLTLLSGYLLRCCCLVCVPALYHQTSSSLVLGFLLEYLTIILPAILTFTLLADYAVYILLANLALCALLVALSIRSVKPHSLKHSLMSAYPVRQPYITVTRTFVNLFTAIAILGVDFPIYPRRLAKAETYGSGMMDVGVGAFLMAHGVTSPEARGSAGVGRRGHGYGHVVGATLRGVLPLLVLGLLRLASVKSTGYQEHVTEYGVHWNFFFTIAAVRILCSVLHPLLTSLPYGYGAVAMVTGALYQVALHWGGLEWYVLHGPNGDGSRTGLLSANREGIVSCVGYLVVYTGWVQVGKWLFKSRRVLKEYIMVLMVLVLMFACFWLATTWCGHHVTPISRRLVNLSYILWIFSYGTLTLSTTLFIDLVVLLLTSITDMPRPPPYATSGGGPLCAASAVDYNQLVFFVLANILTGLVNFSMDTLHADSAVALIVLTMYMATLLAVFLTLHRFKVKVKI